MSIVGQEKLLNFINSSTIDTFPRTIMLVGDAGSGKHLICDYIASKFNLLIDNISDRLTLETIEDAATRVSLCLYIIESNKITVKEENTILKFLEEPPRSCFIIILCENPTYILNTVKNRCFQLRLENYNSEQIQKFIPQDKHNSTLARIAKTPGQAKQLLLHPVDDMVELAVKMYNSIANANFANALTISDKLAFKAEKDKFDYKIFLQILLFVITDIITTNDVDNRYYQAYQLTSDLYNKQYIPHIDNKMLFENYSCKLRKCMKGETYGR